MGELLERALSPEIMNRAWKCLKPDKAVWETGLSRAAMEPNAVLHLLRLIEDVQKGHYRPAPLRQFTVPKGDGRLRVLSALSLRDKLLQRAVLTVLEPIGEALFHHDSFGYRPNRNVEMALRRVRERIACGLPWLVDGDIRSFFDEIPHRALRKVLKQRIPDRDLLALIDAWLAVGPAQSSIFNTRRGIPQGAILSPILCNLYLHELDQALAARNLPFVRYADDFLLFTPDQKTAEKARQFVSDRLDAMGLELHPEKTRIVLSGPDVVFLGQPLPRPPKALKKGAA